MSSKICGFHDFIAFLFCSGICQANCQANCQAKSKFPIFCYLLDSFGEFCFLSSNMSSKSFCRRGIVKQKKQITKNQWVFCYLLDSLLDSLLDTLQIFRDFVELSDSFWELSSKLSSKSQIRSIFLLFVFFAIANLLGGGATNRTPWWIPEELLYPLCKSGGHKQEEKCAGCLGGNIS